MSGPDVWEFYESVSERDRADLTMVRRQVAAICDLRQEVNAGGFDVYLRYWGGDTATDAVAALPSMLGDDWAQVLREAMALLGPDYPVNVDTREGRLSKLSLDAQLHELDDRFYQLEASTDADARLTHVLRRADT